MLDSLDALRLPRLLPALLCALLLVACGGGNSGSSNNGDTNNENNGETNNGETNNGETNNGETNNGETNNGNNTPLEGLTLSVGAQDARSCEVVISDPEERIASVSFEGGVQGRFMRRGERLALAFIADGDAAMGDGSVLLSASSGAALSLQVSRCFDKQGQALGDPMLALLEE